MNHQITAMPGLWVGAGRPGTAHTFSWARACQTSQHTAVARNARLPIHTTAPIAPG